MENFGKKIWAVADGYIPGKSTGPEPEMESHDTLCFLNTSNRDAHIRVTIYFSDREPAGPYLHYVSARRTSHMRFNSLEDPEPLPSDKDFAALVESDVPIIVQQTKLDSRQAENAICSTIAFC